MNSTKQKSPSPAVAGEEKRDQQTRHGSQFCVSSSCPFPRWVSNCGKANPSVPAATVRPQLLLHRVPRRLPHPTRRLRHNSGNLASCCF
jgi:hypothetical protein